MLNIVDGKVIRNIRNEPLSTGCNKSVNAHNDLCFSNDGTQFINDYAGPTLSTATFTLGETRNITFERLTKELDGDTSSSKWHPTDCKHWVKFKLDNGSLFVLEVLDNQPIIIPPGYTHLHKTKHKVQFKNDGISFSFVFCVVRSNDKFHPTQNYWLFDKEDENTVEKVCAYLKNIKNTGKSAKDTKKMSSAKTC